MTKETISQDYMADWKARSARKIKPNRARKILVTGASRKGNIGRAIVDALNEYPFAPTSQSVRTHFESWDARNGCEFDELYTDLVMCHAVIHMDWFEDQPPDQIIDQFNINLVSQAMIAQQFVKATINNRYRKSITFIGSMAHRNVLNGSAPYCASKAGLNMLARCLAWELAPKGYSVYIIHPSNVQDAPMSEDTIQGLMRYRDLSREDAEAYWGAVCPNPDGFLTKDEIARLVRDLIVGKFPYLAGCPIELGGGQR